MPTLILPTRFQNAPFDGDYYKILGLSNNNPTSAEIKAAFKKMSLIYHPDKILNSTLEPPLSVEEANQCFLAITEIQSILLFRATQSTSTNSQTANEINSADDLLPGEQLKAVILSYVRSARFFEYSEGTGPHQPGYWMFLTKENNIEIGTSKYSEKLGIATLNYQVELNNTNSDCWKTPLIVWDKRTQPFTNISNPKLIQQVLLMMANLIPKEKRDHDAKIYGSHVCERLALSEELQPPSNPFKPQKRNHRVLDKTTPSTPVSSPKEGEYSHLLKFLNNYLNIRKSFVSRVKQFISKWLHIGTQYARVTNAKKLVNALESKNMSNMPALLDRFDKTIKNHKKKPGLSGAFLKDEKLNNVKNEIDSLRSHYSPPKS